MSCSLARPISPPAKRRKADLLGSHRADLVREDQASRNTQAAPNQTPWKRTPLNPELSEIRILRLYRGTGSAPIKCELLVVSLDDNPYYEVLSYVWGDHKNTRRIQVDATRFDATVNLFDFLHSLRSSSIDKYIWADAICIHQSSEEEKRHQIGLMTKIYRQAKEAHIWFGPFDVNSWSEEFASDSQYTSYSEMTAEKWQIYQREGTTSLEYLVREGGFKALSETELKAFTDRCVNDIFLQTLAVLDDMARDDHLYTYPVVALDDTKSTGARHKLNMSWLMVMDCIRWLLTRRWWTRVWTLQEASLPRVDPTVHTPPYSFKLSRLLNGIEAMWSHNNSICCKWFGQPITTSNRDDHEFGESYTQCRAVHQQRAVLADADQEGRGVPLEHVISATQGREATEIRDHWFGIFGFLPEKIQEQSKLFPTPSTVAGLFSQCANTLYLESEDLTQLDLARRCKSSLIDGLPSWAIDLSNPRTGIEENCHRWTLYNACGKTKYDRATQWLELERPDLNVKAIYISSVQVCAEHTLPASNTPEDARKLVNEWLALYRDTVCPFDGDAFWRATFMDRNVQRHWLERRKGPLSTVRLKDIKEWWAAWNSTRDHRDLSVDRKAGGTVRGRFHYKELRMNAEKLKFFVTSQGLPGMGPHDVQASDDIYAIAGCQALVVLRPSSMGDIERPTVVGLCFVDRWMYGRATQGGAVWKAMQVY